VTTPLESAIVRLQATDGTIVGAGFLVGDRYIVTCAHVVANALDVSRESEDKPVGILHLDFPLITPGDTRTACVILWKSKDDIAGLELDSDPPATTQPVRLVTARDFWLHPFRAFGFPTGYDDGVWASGVLRGRQATGWVQIEDIKEPGYWVQPGFSGTPVWNEQLNGVVGMAVAADIDRATKAAFMIPAQALIEAWPELAEHSLEAGSLEHFQMQLARLEEAQRRTAHPGRFRPQIDALRERIATWGEHVERQRERVAEGLEEQRRQMAEERARRREKERLRAVGQPPLDVVDYFRDRQRDLNRIRQLLAEPTNRLVSVIGHGGMGKTALACKVLRDLERHRWPHTGQEVPVDGIVYLSTRTAGISLERLFLDCAKLVGGEEQERLNAVWTNPQLEIEDKIARLLEALSEGRYVILMDNLEDLLDDQGKLTDEDLRLFFEQSLMASQGAQLMVTSRVALAFRREVMRFDQQVKLLEGLPTNDGMALLRELDPNGDYGLRDAPEEQLAEAVELAHGVPRALEVLAGILASDPFATLDDVVETFYEQQDVVQALIEENYKRLDREARRVVEVLAVFKKPVPPLAIDYLLEPFAPGLDVPSVVRRLTRTNIVSVDRAAKTVVLHPLDQDYAYCQLPDEGETESAYTRQALERRAADYYVQLRTPPETWKSIGDLEPQLNEFEHRVRAEDYDDACQVLEPIDLDYLDRWSHYARLVEMRKRLLGRVEYPSLQMANLGGLGHAYHALGRVEDAIKLYEEALAIAREIGDRRREGFLLGNIGRAYRDLGQVERAIPLLEKALAIAKEVDDPRETSDRLGNLGVAYHVLGQIERAIALYEEALAIARDIGDRAAQGRLLGSLGITHGVLGRLEQASTFYEQALAIAREAGDRAGQGRLLGSLGNVHYSLGRTQEAITCYEQAVTIARETGDRTGEGRLLGSLGRVHHALGQIERAIAFYKQALDIAREVGDHDGESYQALGLGRTLLTAGELTEARQLCEESRDLDVPWTDYRAVLTLGIIFLHQHDETVGDAFADAIARCQAMLDKTPNLYDAIYVLATALVGNAVCDSSWAEKHERPRLLAQALDQYRRALDHCAAPGIVDEAHRDLEMLRAAGVSGLEPAFELLKDQLDEGTNL
jgi:tetratricopeptide (TPR) repeat protein